MHYARTIENSIDDQLFKGKVLIIYGARRTGKTTLAKQIVTKYADQSKYLNCDLHQYKSALSTTNSELLRDFIGTSRLVVFDEAQQIENIGMILKVLTDTFPDIQYIATGSSSFDLSSKITEPLTGRSRQYLMFPLSLEELHQQHDLITLQAKLPNILRFGLYPEVFASEGTDIIEELNNIASNYLYKDILQFENVKKPDLVYKLLKAIAFQAGSECSLTELANISGSNVHTVQRYLDLLEKSFIIFRLTSFSRNLRKEISKSQKIFFNDVGIRNTIIQNFNELSLRNDGGGLWENFCISERIKYNQNNRRFVNTYFWRTYDQKEIDYIEEKDGHLLCFEFKLNPKSKAKIPHEFIETYPNSSFKIISPENFYELFS